MQVLALAVLDATEKGKNILMRTAPSMVAARLGIPSAPPLEPSDLVLPGNGRLRSGGGLIVVGSHVSKTTAQGYFAVLLKRGNVFCID